MNVTLVKNRMNKVACAILIFIGILSILQVVIETAFIFVKEIFPDQYSVAYSIASGSSYILSYFLSAFVYKLSCKKEYSPISFSFSLGDHPVAYITAALGIAFTASHLMSYLGFGGTLLNEEYHGEDIVLMLFTTVLIPAFCEEFFFRGLIMSNLMPLGRNFAIIASGIIFGLVHGNHDQILFATIVGIVLGWLYADTGSMWCGIIVHMFNNLISVVGTVLVGTLEYDTALKICAVIETTVIVCGAISVIYLIPKLKNKKSSFYDKGFFGSKQAALCDCGITYSGSDYIKGFFSPAMIAFIVYVIFNEVVYVIAF